MTPEMMILVAQILLKYGPVVAEELAVLFHAPDPTLADWQALFAKVKTYEDYVPNVVPPLAAKTVQTSG